MPRPAAARLERGRVALAAACVLGATGAIAGRGAFAADASIEWSDVRLVDGRTVRAADLRRQTVVVEVWATWCPFCKKQNPHVQALHESTGGKGLFVLTFALDKDEAAAAAYLRRYGYTFAAAPYTAQVERWFGRRRGLPEVYVVDANGRIVLREEGEMFPEDVAALARFAVRG